MKASAFLLRVFIAAAMAALCGGCHRDVGGQAMHDMGRMARGQRYSHRDRAWYDQPRGGWHSHASQREANNAADYQRFERQRRSEEAYERRRADEGYGPGSFLNHAVGTGHH